MSPTSSGLSIAFWLVAIAVGLDLQPAIGEESDATSSPSEVSVALTLAPGPKNPRNSEGDFVQLVDGRLLFVYSHYYAGDGDDHDPALLAGRSSEDGGRTWSSSDEEIVPNEGRMNVMSVNLLRLQDGRIALAYLRKNSTADCRPYLRFSTDEAKTWSEPTLIIPEAEVGYYVLNNDRLTQLSSGRLVAPVAQHSGYQMEKKWTGRGRLCCYLSDDGGRTWRRSRESVTAHGADDQPITCQEPGVVELANGELLMYIRTDAGSAYFCRSHDGGDTWSKPVPSALSSPLSPASIERIPQTGHLLAVWNNRSGKDSSGSQKRTPLTTAISEDEGQTWGHQRNLETDDDGWYCYTAIEFVESRVLLGYCAGKFSTGGGLSTTRVINCDVNWLYETK